MGSDILAQSKSGMGKTAIYILAILNQMDSKPAPDAGLLAIILTHTHELAFQVSKEFARLGKYLPSITSELIHGGTGVDAQKKILKEKNPHIIIGTPGRVANLAKFKTIDLSKVKYFVIDECDKMLEELDMREDIQYVFCCSPKEKQVMLLSATLPKEYREIGRKFLRPVFS